MLSHSGSSATGSHGSDEPRGITCLWQIHCDLQRQEKCRVHQLNMCAFVSGAQSWDVGIFKWVNNVVRLYPCAVYKSLNAPYRLFRVASWLALSRRFLPSLNFFFFFYIQCIFHPSRGIKPPFLAKKNICTSTNFFKQRNHPTGFCWSEIWLQRPRWFQKFKPHTIPGWAYPKLVSMCDAGTDRDLYITITLLN